MSSPAQAVTTVGAAGRTAIPVCGGATANAPASSPPTAPRTLLDHRLMGGFTVSGNKIYALDSSAKQLVTFDNSYHQVGSYAVVPGGFAVDPSGYSYFVEANYSLVKRSPAGAEVWRHNLASPITGIVGVPVNGTWTLVVQMRTDTQYVDAATGTATGPATLTGGGFSTAHDGSLVATDGLGVTTYGPDLQRINRFAGLTSGAASTPEGAPLHLELEGGAVLLDDGRYLVADGNRGIYLMDRRGVRLGLAATGNFGGLTQSTPLALLGTDLVYMQGTPYSSNQGLSVVSVASVLTWAAGATPDSRLGLGAGLVTGVLGNYFTAGSTPQVKTAFDASWASQSGVSLQYTVRRSDAIAQNAPAVARSLDLTQDVVTKGASLDLSGATGPGAYEVDAHLLDGGTELSATCVHYTVAAPGMTLDLATLPGKADAGGPDGPRAVALADDLGLGAARLALDWRKLLASDGSTDFSKYDVEVQAASTEAARRHVLLSVQLGSGGPERAFVDNGTWGARVQAVIAHFAPYVDYWEPWNEPNISYGTATNYVRNILHPFSEAVKAADPTAKRLGGTVVGVGSVPYWEEIVRAGGLEDMDIAAIHPYPGHNRSFEEEGFVSKIRQTKAAFAAGGKPDLPIWITEFAFWSNGPANWFGQADKSVRAKVICQSLGIDNWEYFLAQGTWGNDGVTFSAIEGDQVVKPAAIALMAARTELQGRAFGQWVPTSTPHVLVARYGPRDGGTDSVLVAWSDDAAVPMVLKGGGGKADLTDQYGRSRTLAVGNNGTLMTLTGSVQYLSVPAGSDLALSPLETWGPDVALASAGATATATSHNPLNLEVKAIDGEGAANGQGDFRSSSAWASAPGDAEPALTVTLSGRTALDRVVYATGGLGSVQSGIRDTDVDVLVSDGTWQRVGQVRNAFAQRTSTVTFPVVTASAVRLTVRSVNLGGYNGGAAPWFWPTDTSSLSDGTQPWYGPAIVREIEAYGPGDLARPADPDAQVPPTAPSPPLVPPTSSPSLPPVMAPPMATPPPSTEPGTPAPVETAPALPPSPNLTTPSAPSTPENPTSPPPSPPTPSGPVSTVTTPPAGSANSAPPTAPATSTSPPTPAPGGTKSSPPLPLATMVRAPESANVIAGMTVLPNARLMTTGGDVLAGHSVQLQIRPHGAGAWSAWADATTDRKGFVRFSIARRVNTDLRVVFAGTPQLRSSTSAVATLYARRVVTVWVSRTAIRRGEDVHLTGRVSPTATGTVYVETLVGGTWRTLVKTTLDHGAYRATYRLPRSGNYVLRIVRLGDTTTVTSRSRVLQFRAV